MEALALIFLICGSALGGQFSPGGTPVPDGNAVSDDQNKEMTQFFKAKENLFKSDWAAAKAGLEQYLRDYPSGRLQDEALYWIAVASNYISKVATDSGRMIALREEAVQSLTRLIDGFPGSFWTRDALVLRKEICRDLDNFGFSQYRAYLNPAEEKAREHSRNIGVLGSLQELDRGAALPILYNLAKTDPSEQVRIVAIFLLGQNERDTAIPFLQSLALNDPDESVRREAEAVIGRIRMNRLPVRLAAYFFEANLGDRSDEDRFPENEIKLFDVPSGLTGAQAAEESIMRFSNGKFGVLESRNAGRIVNDRALEYFGRFSEYSWAGGNDFSINFLNSDLKKEPARISGMLRVYDRLTKDRKERPFVVDARHDVLAVLRRGEKLTMVYFQFENFPDTRLTSREISRESITPIHKTTFQNLLDCVVVSSAIVQKTRSEASVGETLDLGSARAEIPGKGGTWILEGMLLCDKKARLFIGRQFTLTDPQGKVVSKGAYIEVPADNPQGYRTSAGEVRSKTAVILSPELVKLAERRIFDAGKLLEFKVGAALSDALAREVMRYDGTASIRESEPASGEFDRIFKFSLDKARSGLKRLGDWYIGGINKNEVGPTEFGDLAATQNRTTIQQRYTLAVQLDVLDGRTMKPIRSERIEGYGVYSQRHATTSLGGAASPVTGDGADFEAKKFKKACDDAIAQVTASLAKALGRL